MFNQKKFTLAALLLSVPAQADLLDKTPTVTLSGEGSATFYSFNATQKGPNGGRGNGIASGVDDTRLNIEAEGETTNYGGLIFSYLMGITGSTKANTTSVEESRVMIKGRFGRFYIGGHRPVSDRMPKGTHNTQVASGGIVGNYANVVNVSTGVNHKVDLVGVAKNSNKVTYISPRVKGFQLGFSFTPNSTHQGDDKQKSFDNAGVPFTKNNVDMALNHIIEFFDNWMLKTSVTAVLAKARTGSKDAYLRHDAKSYAVGFELSYKDLTWAAEFIDNGKSLARKDVPRQNAGQVYSTGLSYAMGNNTFSFGYLHSERRLGEIKVGTNKPISPKAKADVFSLGVERKVASGLKLYAEGTRFIYKTHEAWAQAQGTKKEAGFGSDEGTGSNKGTVFILGTKVTF